MSWITDLFSSVEDTIPADAHRLRDRVAEGDHENAIIILAQYTGEDQQRLVNEAAALGADRAQLDEMMQIFGRGETIHIELPTRLVFPRWPLVVMALGGVVVGAVVRARTARR